MEDDDSKDEDAGDQMKVLTDALARARALVAGLEEVRAEAEQSPREDLTPEQLAEGREALENALASARRMLAALEEAYEIALDERRAESEGAGRDGDSGDDDLDDGQPVN